MENAILNKKRFEYENKIQRSPISYEIGFDYIRLEKSLGDVDTIRKVIKYTSTIKQVCAEQNITLLKIKIKTWIL